LFETLKNDECKIDENKTIVKQISASRTWEEPQPIGGGSSQPKVAYACHVRNLEICPGYCINVLHLKTVQGHGLSKNRS
jgi:hypothetical protein